MRGVRWRRPRRRLPRSALVPAATVRRTVRWLRAVNGMLCSPCEWSVLRDALLSRRKVDGATYPVRAGGRWVPVGDDPPPLRDGSKVMDASFQMFNGRFHAAGALRLQVTWSVYWFGRLVTVATRTWWCVATGGSDQECRRELRAARQRRQTSTYGSTRDQRFVYDPG